VLSEVHPRRDCGQWITHVEAAASLKRLWLVDSPSQSSRAEETSVKEGAVEEKSEKKAEAERSHYTLTPSSCTACCLTKGTERSLRQ